MPVFVGTGSDDFEAKSDRIGLPVETTDPASPSTGDAYFNSTDGVIKVYDGTSWNPVGGSLPQFNIDDGFRVESYTGNGGTQTFFTDMDTTTDCFVWIRTSIQRGAKMFSTSWGNEQMFQSQNGAADPVNVANTVTFTSSGIQVGSQTDVNNNGTSYKIYIWKKTQGLFDMVTWTGDNVNGRTISHNLGARPKMIWIFSHAGTGSNSYGFHAYFHHAAPTTMYELTNGGQFYVSSYWDWKMATPTEFYVSNLGQVNQSGISYTAFIWGGSEDDPEYPIKCGVYAGNNNSTQPFTLDISTKAPMLFMTKSMTGGQNITCNFADKEQGFTNTNWSFGNYAGINLNGAVDFTSNPGKITITTNDSFYNQGTVNSKAGRLFYMYIDDPT